MSPFYSTVFAVKLEVVKSAQRSDNATPWDINLKKPLVD